MRRREFITILGGAAAWPLTASAQQPERMRRIGVLSNRANDRLANVLVQELQRLGWTIGRNLQIDYRYSAGNPERVRTHAAELSALVPDVVLAIGSLPVAAFQTAAPTVPLVFVTVVDPVGAGFVDG